MRLVSALIALCLAIFVQAQAPAPINQGLLKAKKTLAPNIIGTKGVKGQWLGNYSAALASMAQKSAKRGTPLRITFNPEFRTPSHLAGFMTDPSSDDPKTIAARFVNTHRAALMLDAGLTLTPVETRTGKLGNHRVRMRLYKNGVEVWPAEFSVHLDKQGRITTFHGNYRSPRAVSTNPLIKEVNARTNALTALAPKVPVDITSNLIIYDWHVDKPMLAWRVHIAAQKVYPLREDIFVDALSGEIINRIDRIYTTGGHTHKEHKHKDHNHKAATTVTVQPFLDSNATRTTGAYEDNGNTFLIHTGKQMFPGTLDPSTLAGTIHTLNAQNTDASESVPFGNDPNGDGTLDDDTNTRAAGAAHYWMSEVYDWLLATFNWNSFDNNGSALRLFVNFRQDPNQGLDNAFWTGRELVFGDGGSAFENLAYGADVAAHELCHAITDATAQLVYQFESGALNESFSDIYAALFDDGNWEIGETIVKPAFGAPALRSMSDPNQGTTRGGNGWQPKHMDEFVNLTAQQDNGGVHINSGIANHAFYRLAINIGRADAGQIMHRALTTYLNRNSTFPDMRTAAESSARDLFGENSNQFTAVQQAYSDVGIGAQNTEPPPGQAAYTLYYPLSLPFSTYGESYSSAIYVTNPGDEPVSGTVFGVAADGSDTGSLDFTLNPKQTSWAAAEAGDQWLRIEADAPLIGAYQHINPSGTAWSLIPATPFINNGMFIPHIATNTEKFWTVGGLANVVDTPSSVVYADNASDDGLTFNINNVGESTAFDFEALYTDFFGGLPDFSAVGGLWGLFLNFDFDSSEILDFNLVGAEIFGRKDVAQVAGLQMDATSGRTLYFTHVASNAAFWTGYSLVNISDPALGTIPIRIISFDNAGNELSNKLTELPPFGKLLRLTRDDLVPDGASWFTVSAQREGASLTGMELFGSFDDQQMAGFQALPYTARKFYFPFVISGTSGRPTLFDGLPTNYTGISIINPNPTTVNLTVTLHTAAGQTLTATGPLGPNGKLLNLVSDIFGTDYYGYIEVEADRPVAGFSLSGFTNQQEWAANPMVILD